MYGVYVLKTSGRMAISAVTALTMQTAMVDPTSPANLVTFELEMTADHSIDE